MFTVNKVPKLFFLPNLDFILGCLNIKLAIIANMQTNANPATSRYIRIDCFSIASVFMSIVDIVVANIETDGDIPSGIMEVKNSWDDAIGGNGRTGVVIKLFSEVAKTTVLEAIGDIDEFGTEITNGIVTLDANCPFIPVVARDAVLGLSVFKVNRLARYTVV